MFDKSKVIIQTKMNMKRKPSLNKVNEKKLSVTAREMFWPQQQKPLLKEKESIQKLPPIRRTLRNVSAKTVTIQPIQARKQTQTTLNESTMMFQSMYGGKDWLKPSDYVKEITQLNLLGQQKNVQAKSFDINLTQKFQKNLQKYGRLKEVTQKWVQVLKKALSYIKSTRASSDKLVEQVKFWKILSRKYDQLQYEFNIKDEKTTTLLAIMKKVLKSQPMYRPLLEQFLALKQEIVNMTPSIKKLYLQLEEVVSGFIIKLQQCSDIVESISLLKNILIAFDSIYHDNPLIRGRFIVICEKIDQCMTQKLIATSLYPRQLANISSVKQNYQIIDQSLSFYSHFINLLQSTQIIQGDLIQKIQYSRQVVGNLLQILIFFQHLYKNKQVNQFSKLFCHPLDYNIYDRQNSEEWNNYMDIVNQSMEKHNFQP